MPADFCFTVDLDRDVNLQVPGHVEAGSLDRGGGTSPRFSSTLRGLELLVGILDDIGLPCTFFCEGRTLEVIRDHSGLLDGFDIGVHGYDHECLSDMSDAEAAAVICRAVAAVRDVTGRAPTSFRAPYMSPPRNLCSILDRCGIKADSSEYAVSGASVPSVTSNGLVEVPVTEGSDSKGKKISAYLWPMHEGRRPPVDYVELSRQVPDDGVFTLADHTWHIVESRSKGILDPDDLALNVSRTREVLMTVMDACSSAVTVSETAGRAALRRAVSPR